MQNGWTEQVIVQLGYLGLILLVYEGGLNTDFKFLKANAGLSVMVVLTGICLPIAFAFCLQSLASATPLQAFAAGAALCSTSSGHNVYCFKYWWLDQNETWYFLDERCYDS